MIFSRNMISFKLREAIINAKNLENPARTACLGLWLYCAVNTVSIHCFGHSNSDCIPLFCLWVADIDTILGCPVAIALMSGQMPGIDDRRSISKRQTVMQEELLSGIPGYGVFFNRQCLGFLRSLLAAST